MKNENNFNFGYEENEDVIIIEIKHDMRFILLLKIFN